MYKQAIVIRSDLEMGKGKIAAQASHASLQAYILVDEETRDEWMQQGGRKITLKVSSQKELLDVYKLAKSKKVPCALIHDAGHTQVAPGTVTALGIGPAEEVEINEITGKLKLL